MKHDKKNGRFLPCKNRFEQIDGLIYCYSEEDELLFFTDDKRVLKHSWGKAASGYCGSHINGKQVLLHRFLLNPQSNELVDHINRNKKDNRIANLRNTNKSINAFNCGVRKNNTSGVTGVWFRKDTNKWTAEIKVNLKKLSLGCFFTKEEAIKARKEAEAKYYGNK